MTKETAAKFWVSHELPRVRRQYEEDTRQPDYTMRKQAWGSFTRFLYRCGKITGTQYHKWSAPACCVAPKQRRALG